MYIFEPLAVFWKSFTSTKKLIIIESGAKLVWPSVKQRDLCPWVELLAILIKVVLYLNQTLVFVTYPLSFNWIVELVLGKSEVKLIFCIWSPYHNSWEIKERNVFLLYPEVIFFLLLVCGKVSHMPYESGKLGSSFNYVSGKVSSFMWVAKSVERKPSFSIHCLFYWAL